MRSNSRNVLALLITLVALSEMRIVMRADGQVTAGRNINLHPGIVDQYVGDKYLQRQLEPKVVCTIPQHCLAIANDYRTVDAASDLVSGFGEGSAGLSTLQAFNNFFGLKTNRASLPDAWLGLYRTTNLENWLNGLVPGFPQGTNNLDGLQPWFGKAAASDGDLATDGVHFYGTGMFFDRGGASMIGGFRLTDFNDESAVPIRWDAAHSRIIDQRPSPSTTAFLDLPSIAVDPTPRTGSVGGCGNVYIGYTAFTGTNGDSSIKFVRSSDCGQTYSSPITISGNFKKNQRVVFGINPRPGTPLTTGGGLLYAVWRTFAPDMIAGAVSWDFGMTWSPAVAYSVLNGVNTVCAYDQPTVGTLNDLAVPAYDTARAVAFPTLAIDSNGALHLAWSERVDALGNAAPSACKPTMQPKIVITSSFTGGLTWTKRHAVDMGARCETIPADNRPGGRDRSIPNGTIAACTAAGNTGRLSGPQIQPVLSHNAGKLMLLYSEGRGGLNLTVGSPSYGYHSGRDAEMDVRAAQINPANETLIGTTQVSLYTYDTKTNDIKTVAGVMSPAGARAYNRAYLPQYKGGTSPFRGDHDGLAPAEPVVWDSPAHFPTAADVPGARFIGIWGGDNRESLFPAGDINGPWNVYGFPGCNAGIRNSNDYATSIGSSTEAFVYQSFKPANDPFFQHTWVVTVRNRSDFPRTYKFALEEPGGRGSFDQFQDVNVIGNTNADPFCRNAAYPTCTAFRTILPNSSMTFTVFGTITDVNKGGPIRVDVFESTTDTGATAVTNNTLAVIVRLNPNPNNAPLADPSITTTEHHAPSVTGPDVQTFGSPTPGNPTPGNPTPGNPTLAFPTPGNPTPGNPTPGNPTPGNAGFSDYSDYTFFVSASDANTASQYAAFANIANPTAVGNSHLVQLIITRPHGVPTVDVATQGCPQIERSDDELVSMITVPTPGNLGVPTPGNPTPGNPTPGNPTPGNTTQFNPTPGNPTPGNNTFAVSTFAAVPLSAENRATRFAESAVASTSPTALPGDQVTDKGPDGSLVSIPDTDRVRVTIRFWHCEQAGGCTIFGQHFNQDTGETVPKAPGAAANNLIGFSVNPAAGDNNQGAITPPVSVTRSADLLISAPEALAAIPSQGTAGSQTSVGGFTIANVGNADAGPFSYRYFLVPTAGIPVALTDSIPVPTGETGVAVGAGGSRDIGPQDVTIPGGTPLGVYTIRVIVDDTNRIGEANETNNSKDASFAVVNTNRIAVWASSADPGGNGIVSFINAMLGFSATVVSTADLETAGFLNTFNALYVTRSGASFGTGLSALAATNVKAYVDAGPVVLFMNDWDDNLPTSAVGDARDDTTSQLIMNAITRAARRHGYVGEFNGAAMALSTNANGFIPLGLITGNAAALGMIPCASVTFTPDGSAIQGSAPSTFVPADTSCTGSAATVAVGNIWATYVSQSQQPAIIGR
jgi:CARDB protein